MFLILPYTMGLANVVLILPMEGMRRSLELVATYVSLPRGMPRRQPTGMFLGPLALA